MKRIEKNREPQSLVEYRSKPNSTYKDIDTKEKDELREALLVEQGYICCYCMQRIPHIDQSPNSKIEHFKCQSNYPSLDLVYANLMIACNGNHGNKQRLQTCDTLKDSEDLTYNPSASDFDIESLIRYKANGEIYSENQILEDEMNRVLNLNHQTLASLRKVVYEEVRDRIRQKGKKRKGKSLDKGFLQKEKEKWLSRNQEGKFRPFCMVAVYYINKQLAKQ